MRFKGPAWVPSSWKLDEQEQLDAAAGDAGPSLEDSGPRAARNLGSKCFAGGAQARFLV